MAETVHLLSKLITTKKDIVSCANLVTALCVIETRIGNLAAAKAHLHGLLAIMDHIDARTQSRDSVGYDDLAHLERCVLIADTFTNRLWDQTSLPGLERVQQVTFTKERDEQLQALGLISYLVNKSPSLMGPNMIDAGLLATSARSSTKHILGHQAPSASTSTSRSQSHSTPVSQELISMYMASSASSLLTWFGSELSPDTEEEQATIDTMVEPVPFYIAANQYFRRILGRRPATPGDETEIRMQWRKLRILKRGILNLEASASQHPAQRNLWFWYVFCGLLGMEAFQRQVQQPLPGDMNKELRSWFAGRVRAWARSRRITRWEDARENLVSILWPESPDGFRNESLAKAVWVDALIST
ncbi:hypothetical protein GQ53DRAFT_740293 [Thozetella sp. PMI_491]|nr:hypothetical protein GQ53DRAFT_740293 [Thozetella sp. PMI_491]